MPLTSQTQRSLLWSFIISLVVCGLLGIVVLLRGKFSRLEESIMLSTSVVGAASILGFCGAIPWERRRWHPLGPVAAAAVAITALVSIYQIWGEYARNVGLTCPEIPWRVVGSAWVVGVALPHIGLISLANLHRKYAWVRRWTVLAIGVLGTLILYFIWDFWYGYDDEVLMRAIGIAAIAVACGTIATPLLHRISALGRRASIRTTDLALTLTCPRCGLSQTLSVGRSACRQCHLRFTIDIEEDNCPKCGYPFYKLESAQCPECGTPLAQIPQGPPASGTPIAS